MSSSGERAKSFSALIWARVFGFLRRLPALTRTMGTFGSAASTLKDRSCAHRGAFVAGVVEDPLRSFLHLAQILDGRGIRHAVPNGFAVVQQVVEGIDAGFDLKRKKGINSSQFGVRSSQWSEVSFWWSVVDSQLSADQRLVTK